MNREAQNWIDFEVDLAWHAAIGDAAEGYGDGAGPASEQEVVRFAAVVERYRREKAARCLAAGM